MVIISGLAINGAVLISALVRGRLHLPTLSGKEKRIAAAFSISVAINAGCAAFILWHPFGWLYSTIAGLAAYIVGMFVQIWVGRRLWKGISETDFIGLQDRVLKVKEEPNPLYWIP